MPENKEMATIISDSELLENIKEIIRNNCPFIGCSYEDDICCKYSSCDICVDENIRFVAKERQERR